MSLEKINSQEKIIPSNKVIKLPEIFLKKKPNLELYAKTS